MPVSRKRKKNGKSVRKPRPVTQALPSGIEDMASAFAGWGQYRRQLDEHRAARGAAAAEPMIAELVGLAATSSGAELEDELCVRIGAALTELNDSPIDDHVGPAIFAGTVIDAAVAAVDAALAARTDSWMHPWRVLTTVAGILVFPLNDRVEEAVDALRTQPGGDLLPATPAGPTVTGPVLWARDAYGSRFGVAAPIRTADGPERWYLWDIDACGHDAFTVHSRYHASRADALADWQDGVGAPAADGTAFTPIDDPWLLGELLPREQGMMRPGGENAEQFAEYYRSKRLAESVLTAIRLPRRESTRAGLDRTAAATLFSAWLGERRPDVNPDDQAEQIGELADSWHVGDSDRTYHTCSPHRVALVVEHVRGYYDVDFADELIALLPDWTAWLAERNATPAPLADRCRPYVQGDPYKALLDEDGRPNYLIRVAE